MKTRELKFKKGIVLIGLIIAVLLLTFALSACDEPDLTQEVVRIHIRANSNSDIDQEVKLRVRDSVTEYLTERLEGVNSKAQALETLDASKAEITKIANEVLAQNGFDYKANIYRQGNLSRKSLRRIHFPRRRIRQPYFKSRNGRGR